LVSIVVVVENALYALQQILDTLTGAIERNWKTTWREEDEGGRREKRETG